MEQLIVMAVVVCVAMAVCMLVIGSIGFMIFRVLAAYFGSLGGAAQHQHSNHPP